MTEFQGIIQDENGNLFELSNKIHIGKTAPQEDYKYMWVDTAKNEIKVKVNGAWIQFGGGSAKTTTTTTTHNLPIDSRLIVATLTQNDQFSFVNTLKSGSSVRVVVRNASLSDITIALPTNSQAYLFCPSLEYATLAAGETTCFDVVSDGSVMYITNFELGIANILSQI